MNTWIFQGNPDRFNVNESLKYSDYIYWTVKHKVHQDKIKIGDQIFLWRAKGNSKLEPGIVAIGVIVEECKSKNKVNYPELLSNLLWDDPELEVSEIKAGIKVTELRLSPKEGMIPRSNIRSDPLLSQMQIIKAGTGSNFLISTKDSDRIRFFWKVNGQLNDDIAPPEYQSLEGKTKYNLHRFRERDQKLITKAKSRFLAIHGTLYCEICGFSFAKVYGELGDGFIEAHHVKPMEYYEEEEVTSIDDLMMVCSNCHRMIHRGDAIKNLDDLISMF